MLKARGKGSDLFPAVGKSNRLSKPALPLVLLVWPVMFPWFIPSAMDLEIIVGGLFEPLIKVVSFEPTVVRGNATDPDSQSNDLSRDMAGAGCRGVSEPAGPP